MEKDVEEKREFRGDLSGSLKVMTISQAEDNLWKTQNKAAESEVKELEAHSEKVKNICKKRKEDLQKWATELQSDIDNMRTTLKFKQSKSTSGDSSTTNTSIDQSLANNYNS